MLVAELVDQIPTSTQREVQDTYRRFGNDVRNAVSKAIRLPLSWANKEDGIAWNCSSTVKIDIGYPEHVGRIGIDEEFELAARLQVWLSSMRGFQGSAREMLNLAKLLGPHLDTFVDIPEFSGKIQDSESVVEKLIRLASIDRFNLAAVLLAVNKDILGLFSFDPSEGESAYKKVYRTDISLYWGIIGLIARLKGLSVEGLTATVLAHEYGHAFTHLGFDRKGKRASGHDFSKSDHMLVEALAQYWTVIALRYLDSRIPDALPAYEALLKEQSSVYRAHLPWIDTYSLDTVAAALTSLRPTGPIGYDQFCAELARIEPIAS